MRVDWNQSGQGCEGAECSLGLTVHFQCVPATLGAASHTRHWQVGKWARVKTAYRCFLCLQEITWETPSRQILIGLGQD